ncbi:MAG: O-antigen ligase family protein [Planctomycetota bacterium]|nr:O-antigen ligase family protein [Planctomycetota bacterium]
MKPILMMCFLTLVGTVGCFIYGPICGLTVYYLFATLRPQFMWEWALPEGIAWSFYVAVATIVTALMSGFPMRWSRTHTLALCFAGWVVLSYLMALYPEDGNAYMIDYGKHLVMFIVASLVVQSVREVWTLYLTIALCLCYIAYEINFLYFVNGYLGVVHNGYGGNDNNGAGLLLAIGIPLCYFAWEGMQSVARWAFLAFIPVLLHAVMMTYSRGAMLSIVLMCPILILRSRYKSQLMIGAVAMFFIVPAMAGQEIRARFFSISEHDRDQSAQSRFGSWQAAIDIANDYPILGAGVRNSNRLSYQYGADMEGRTIHSQYLQLAADNGYIGMGLYLSVLVSGWLGLRSVQKSAKRNFDPDSAIEYAASAGLECAMATFCIGSLFLSNEAFELQYLLIFMSAQLAVVAQRSTSNYSHGTLRTHPQAAAEPVVHF